MKANAPEKIYLTSDDNNSYVFTQKRSDNMGVEYTRTDAFIDRALRWMKSQGGVNDTLSREMIEDFRKYMKGE